MHVSHRMGRKCKKINRSYHATYPIRLCDVSDTARDKNVDSVNIVSTSCGHVESKNVAGACHHHMAQP